MSLRIQQTAREWLSRARSNYLRSQQPKPAEVYWEDLCYDAQQAAEKALKALFIWHGKRFPFSHDIGELIVELEAFLAVIPDSVRKAASLTDYAIATRYPGWGQPVTETEFLQAAALAKQVLDWVSTQVR